MLVINDTCDLYVVTCLSFRRGGTSNIRLTSTFKIKVSPKEEFDSKKRESRMSHSLDPIYRGNL